MCGIAGFITEPSPEAQQRDDLSRMAGAIAHRGPDASGVWLDPTQRVGLAHRRLAVIELSEAGSQPMTSACGRYTIVYNGEIYNHLEVRRLLPEQPVGGWRGGSDTETLLAGFTTWGIEPTLHRVAGMFAFAVWDRVRGVLTLARDRMGEKPLYYGLQRSALLFGSELSALAAHPAFVGGVDPEAIASLMHHNYIAGPRSIHPGIRKLEPGSLLELTPGGGIPAPRRYWSLSEVARAGVLEPFRGSPDDAVEALHSVLADVVAGQMLSDVPLGAFLSGGIDSSTVVALMQARSSRPVRTFSIGSSDPARDEAVHARAIARHLGTSHTELILEEEDLLRIVPTLPEVYDEPFADSSQIPTVAVSELARRAVTVSLSGDGGDELFAGYRRYAFVSDIRQRYGAWGAARRTMLSGALRTAAWLPGTGRKARGWRTLARMIEAPDLDAAYAALLRRWEGSADGPAAPGIPTPPPELRGVERMMYVDQMGYLPDDILVKVDRAGMRVSLESRIPLLDHRVVEFAWRMPTGLRVRHGATKWPLRQILARYVPQELFMRPKQGFSVPVGVWLRGPLREWAEDLLSDAALRGSGFFDVPAVRATWSRHLRGVEDAHVELWSVLMAQAWIRSRA